MIRAGVAALAVVVCVALTGCGGHSAPPLGAAAQRPVASAAPIPGAPGVPRWLRVRIWSIASGLGDPRPDKIAVTLHRHEHGRVVDRVWMRGQFICSTCLWTGKIAHLRLVGYTFDAATRNTLSASGQG